VFSLQKFILVEVWETAHQWLCDYFDLAALFYSISKRVGTLKWVTSRGYSFEEKVCGYLQEGLGDIES
jgi:hypothetical protein